MGRTIGFGLCAFVMMGLSGCAADSTSSDDDNLHASTSESIIGGQAATTYEEAALVNGNGYICSGAVIAPRVVLTAGHCVSGSSYSVKAPYANNQTARGTRVWTDYVPTGETVNPNTLDVAVIILDTPITLTKYPRLATAALADGSEVVNVGRIKDGQASYSSLFYGRAIAVNDAAPSFPKAYRSSTIIQSGDSGGPVYSGTGDNRTIVAVNSGASPSWQILARVDLGYAKIQQLIAANGGAGGT